MTPISYIGEKAISNRKEFGMKKKVVAMLILAMLVAGCGANGSDETNVTLETSEEAQGSDAGLQTGTGAADDSIDEDDNTVDMAAGEASDADLDEAGTDASVKDAGAEDDAAADKSTDAATDKTSDVAATEATDKASDDASKDATKKEDASQSNDSSEKATTEEKKETGTLSNLPDGSYNTDFIAAPTQYSSHYIKSIVVSGDEVILEASIYQFDSNWNVIEVGYGTYVLKINSETKFLSGGGEQDPDYMSKDEFGAYIGNLIGSGLGLSFKIQNGYLAEIGIWS